MKTFTFTLTALVAFVFSANAQTGGNYRNQPGRPSTDGPQVVNLLTGVYGKLANDGANYYDMLAGGISYHTPRPGDGAIGPGKRVVTEPQVNFSGLVCPGYGKPDAEITVINKTAFFLTCDWSLWQVGSDGTLVESLVAGNTFALDGQDVLYDYGITPLNQNEKPFLFGSFAEDTKVISLSASGNTTVADFGNDVYGLTAVNTPTCFMAVVAPYNSSSPAGTLEVSCGGAITHSQTIGSLGFDSNGNQIAYPYQLGQNNGHGAYANNDPSVGMIAGVLGPGQTTPTMMVLGSSIGGYPADDILAVMPVADTPTDGSLVIVMKVPDSENRAASAAFLIRADGSVVKQTEFSGAMGLVTLNGRIYSYGALSAPTLGEAR